MPRLTKNNITSSAKTFVSRQNPNNNTMKKEIMMPLIVGIVLGGLVMIFWQFNVRLNNQMAAMAQLEQATAQNTKNVGDIITFINNATGANGQKTPATAPTDTTTPSTK